MPTRETYSSDIKKQVLAALARGDSLRQVAVRYDIPLGTVNGWRQRALKQRLP